MLNHAEQWQSGNGSALTRTWSGSRYAQSEKKVTQGGPGQLGNQRIWYWGWADHYYGMVWFAVVMVGYISRHRCHHFTRQLEWMAWLVAKLNKQTNYKDKKTKDARQWSRKRTKT